MDPKQRGACTIIAFDGDEDGPDLKNREVSSNRYCVQKTNGLEEWMTSEQIILRSNKTLAKAFKLKAREDYVEKQNAFSNMLKPIRSDKNILVSFYMDIVKNYAQKHGITYYDIESKKIGDVIKIKSDKRPNGVNIPFTRNENEEVILHLKDDSNPYSQEFLLARAWLALHSVIEKNGVYTSPMILTYKMTKGCIGRCTLEHCMRQLVATYNFFKSEESPPVSPKFTDMMSDVMSNVKSNVASDDGFEVISDSESVDGYESPSD